MSVQIVRNFLGVEEMLVVEGDTLIFRFFRRITDRFDGVPQLFGARQAIIECIEPLLLPVVSD